MRKYIQINYNQVFVTNDDNKCSIMIFKPSSKNHYMLRIETGCLSMG